MYRWEGQGPIDGIEVDPFDSPYRPRRQPAVSKPALEPPPADDEVIACEVGPSDFKSLVARFERELLARALRDNRYNQRQTADALGLTYDQLRHALRRHDLISVDGKNVGGGTVA